MATQSLGVPSLLSHYRIVEKIGEGGMGAVFRAHDERLDREVAIKVLPPGKLADRATRRRFRHEALALSKLNHPNIATIHDFDTDHDLDFLVMEYIPGRTLNERISQGPLAREEVLGVAIQLLEALCAAHGQGVVHRDLKPANIRQMPDGRIKVLDFGLATVIHAEPEQSTVSLVSFGPSGTLPYMAPEQLRGEACDPRTDIYAAGAVLYEMVTGSKLFPNAQAAQLVDAILHENPMPPSSRVAGISKELELVVLRALNKDPKQRFQSADEFLRELKALAGQSSVTSVHPVNWRYIPVLRTVLRHKRLIGLTCVALVAAVLWSLRTPALAFSARDFIIISDFENQTGDPVFDKSLTTAFNTSIGQSAFANVFSRQRLAEALKRMKRLPTEKVDESVAREIAQREGLNVLVIPSISAIGDRYSISARIHDVSSGRDYHSEVVTANGKNQVLPALDNLAARIRRDLGESSQEISKASKPMAQATTPSLEALRQFSMGVEQRVLGHEQEARTYYENALRIDPNFIAAKASLGGMMIDLAALEIPGWDAVEGKRLLDEASKNLSGLTDRERYGIMASRASRIDRDMEAANASYKALLAEYPDDIATHNNLAWNYAQMGHFDESIQEARAAIRLDPYFTLARLNLGFVYLVNLADMPHAIEAYSELLKYDPNNNWGFNGLGWAEFGRGNYAAAQGYFEKAVQAEPRQVLSRYRLAHAYRLQKNFGKAVEVVREIERLFPKETSALYDEALNREGMGQHQEAVKLWQTYCERAEVEARKQKPPVNRLNIAAALARMGKTKEASAIVDGWLKTHPKAGFDAATVLALLGRKSEAVQQMQVELSSGYTNFVWIKIHPDLDPLRGYPPFEQLMAGKIKS